MRLVLRSGSEQKGVGRARCRAVSKVETPEAVDFQCRSAWTQHVAERRSGPTIEGIDVSIAKIAHQQILVHTSRRTTSCGIASARL